MVPTFQISMSVHLHHVYMAHVMTWLTNSDVVVFLDLPEQNVKTVGFIFMQRAITTKLL